MQVTMGGISFVRVVQLYIRIIVSFSLSSLWFLSCSRTAIELFYYEIESSAKRNRSIGTLFTWINKQNDTGAFQFRSLSTHKVYTCA